MSKNPGYNNNDQQYLPEPPPPYSPRTPPPPQRANIPPAATYIPPASPQYPLPVSVQGTLSSVGKEVGGMFKNLTKAAAKSISKALETPTLDYIKSGNVIQLVSRTTGRCLQILQGPDGRLMLDGLGGEGHQYYNTHFTLVQDKDNYSMLHNNFNYLCIRDGIMQMFSAGPAGVTTPCCRFKIREVLLQTHFVTLENITERGRFVAVLPNGQIKSALATTSTDHDTHFAVRLIYSPYSPQYSKTPTK